MTISLLYAPPITTPLQGVYFFIDKALINDTPEDVAMCLYMEGFNKVAIGKYFGKRYTDPLHHKVLERYLQFVNVSGLGLVEAIREFAKVVTLPSDPGSVEHIMTEFGKHYHQSNPSKFDCAGMHVVCKYTGIAY
jgi:Sec7-like guanine-nucleotide exchange factor